jgi:hypothetical protein
MLQLDISRPLFNFSFLQSIREQRFLFGGALSLRGRKCFQLNRAVTLEAYLIL